MQKSGLNSVHFFASFDKIGPRFKCMSLKNSPLLDIGRLFCWWHYAPKFLKGTNLWERLCTCATPQVPHKRRHDITSVCCVDPRLHFVFLPCKSDRERGRLISSCSFGIPLPRTNSNSRLLQLPTLFSVREKL